MKFTELLDSAMSWVSFAIMLLLMVCLSVSYIYDIVTQFSR